MVPVTKTKKRNESMKRQIISITNETFDYTDKATLGYLIGGELHTEIDDTTKQKFRGYVSIIRESDLWSMIHDGDKQPVTFIADKKNRSFVTYYPRHRDETEFLRVEFKFVA
jgi:hypothetical protein